MEFTLSTLKSSAKPVEKINEVAYADQPWERRIWLGGFSNYMDMMPELDEYDFLLGQKLLVSEKIMIALADELLMSVKITRRLHQGLFERYILAVEDKGTREIIVAKWGKGFESPVHGHSAGFMFERVLYGKIKVDTFRMQGDVAIPIHTQIFQAGQTISSSYNKPSQLEGRKGYIHKLTAVEPSATLHFIAEHSLDGMGNQIPVRRFDDIFTLTPTDVKRITSFEGMYLQKGDVVLVRSSNVPEYGHHYIVVTGHPIKKKHGFRVQDEAISAPKSLLDGYPEDDEFILLQLHKNVADAFLTFHGITIRNGEVVFPKP